MATRTLPRPAPRPVSRPTPGRGRALVEAAPVSPAGAPLRVDPEAGVIFGVKVLGRHSANTHAADGVTGTEYTRECLEGARALYEGVTVRCDHPADRRHPGAAREVDATLGQLRNVRLADDGESLRADLHYLKTHPMAARVVEDVQRGLGVYGLSHNARAGRERVDGGRLVIETIELVRSVDLVDKPATNRNLWESDMPVVMTSLRKLLEGSGLKLPPAARKAATDLLEADADGYADAPIDAVAEATPQEQIAAGFKAAIMAVLEDDKLDYKTMKAKIDEYLKAKFKVLASASTPSQDDDVTEEEEDEEEEDTPKERAESRDPRVDELVRKDRARDLCESLGVIPSKPLLKALCAPGLSAADQKALVEEWAAGKAAPPKKAGPRTGRPLTEATNPPGTPAIPATTTAGLLNRLR